MIAVVKCDPTTNVVDWVEYVMRFAGSGEYSKRDENTLVFNINPSHFDLLKQLCLGAAKGYAEEYHKENPKKLRLRPSYLVKFECE